MTNEDIPTVSIEALVGHKWFDISNELPRDDSKKPPLKFRPIIDDVFMPPFNIHAGYMDLPFMCSLAYRLQPKLVLEYGTGYGNSISNVLKVCPQARAVTVNALPCDTKGEQVTCILNREEIGRVYKFSGLVSRVAQVFADTKKLHVPSILKLAYMNNGASPEFEFGIIDACHDVDYVTHDFLSMLPYLSKTGVILLHDTLPLQQEPFKGSFEACLGLRKHYDIRRVESTWWGVYTPDWAHLLGS